MSNSILNFKCVLFFFDHQKNIQVMCKQIQDQLFSHIISLSMRFVGIDLFISYTGPHVQENKIQTNVCATCFSCGF